MKFTIIILSVLFTAMGLAGGWYSAAQTSKGKKGSDEHAGHADKEKNVKPTLSKEAVKNLGIKVADAETTTWWMYQAVPAVVTAQANSALPIRAPIGGTVSEVLMNPSSMVTSKSVLITLIRDAIPRPALTLTEEIIKPASEQVHSSYGELRRVIRGSEILKSELERIQKFTQNGTTEGLAILPKKNEIDLRYEIARAEQELENAREKLRLHGFSGEQIADMESGKPLIGFNLQIWQRALQRNGLWPKEADQLFNALPVENRATPWTVAAIGELAGAGMINEDLQQWIQRDALAAKYFLEIAGMLQRGHTLTQVQALNKMNVLSPIVELIAPERVEPADPKSGGWDIQEIHVKPQQHVEAGTALLTLSNANDMLLKSEPVGGEANTVLNALKNGTEISAQPLVEGSGPKLDHLKIAYAVSDEHSGTVAFLRIRNEVLHLSEESEKGSRGKYRTWQMRAGQKYLLQIPTKKFDEVYKLPSSAVADDGADKIVFIQDGDSFKTVKVVVLHQDDEVAIIDSTASEIFPGDSVVQNNAFALGLALKAGAGGTDPHAGHNH